MGWWVALGRAASCRGPFKVGLFFWEGGMCSFLGQLPVPLSAAQPWTHDGAERNGLETTLSSPICFGDKGSLGGGCSSRLTYLGDMNAVFALKSPRPLPSRKGILREIIMDVGESIMGKECFAAPEQGHKTENALLKGPGWPVRRQAFPFMCRGSHSLGEEERQKGK